LKCFVSRWEGWGMEALCCSRFATPSAININQTFFPINAPDWFRQMKNAAVDPHTQQNER
jgi:hypothetical protein